MLEMDNQDLVDQFIEIVQQQSFRRMVQIADQLDQVFVGQGRGIDGMVRACLVVGIGSVEVRGKRFRVEILSESAAERGRWPWQQ